MLTSAIRFLSCGRRRAGPVLRGRRPPESDGCLAEGPARRNYASVSPDSTEFIESMNSWLSLVPFILSSRNSIASTGFSWDRSLRRIQTRFRTSFGEQELLLAGAGAVDVDRREDALVHQPAVEVDLHVAGALELLEDHLVHPAAGVDQRRADDGQAAAVLDVARRAEELLRLVQRVRVDAAGEDLAATAARPCCRRARGG